MQLQNVNTSRYLEIENDILKRGIKMSNNHIQDIIDSVLPQISFKSNKSHKRNWRWQFKLYL